MKRIQQDTRPVSGSVQAGSTSAQRWSMMRLTAHYFRFNLSANMAYVGSFVIQAFGMALNNSAFIIFWFFLLERIGGNIAGYGFTDVMFLWSLVATGVGASGVVFGNSSYISRIIYNGELDVYLLQPKPVLANLLVSRMSVAGWGDVLFGIILFSATQPMSLQGWVLYLVFSVAAMLVVTAAKTAYHSLTFFLGNVESLAQMAGELAFSFGLYPGSIFKGVPSYLMHSLIPAALVAHIPAQLFKEYNPGLMITLLAADTVFILVSIGLFRLGLRKYESGNRMGTRL